MARKKKKVKAGRTSKAAKKNRASSGTRATAGKAKFAGRVVMTPPGGGKDAALGNGTRVVVSVAELSVARLPEGGANSELQFEAIVRTTASNGKAVSATWSPGIYYYVPHGSRLNIADTVLFDGAVHQHLSFDLSIVEREMPQMNPSDAAALAEAAAVAAAELTDASGPLGTALEAFPSILGGILKLNGDDQVLKHATSLFTRQVNKPEDTPHWLVEGQYRFEKKRAATQGDPWVTLVLDVRAVSV